MTTTSLPEKTRAAIEVAAAALRVIASKGTDGVPSGHLYAHVMASGLSLEVYESMVAFLVDAKVVTRRGDLLIASPDVLAAV